MKKYIFITVILLAVVIILGGCNATQPNKTPAVNSPSPLLNLPPDQNINTPVAPPVTNLNNPVVTPPPPVNVPPVNVNKPKTSEVKIMNFAFNPGTVNIKVGDTVKWTNNDQPTHRIASNNFNSQDLNTGDSYSYTFTQAGTFDYHCAIHPSMTGTINVTQ